MMIYEEIEKMRKRVLKEINAEFDLLIARIQEGESNISNSNEVKPFEVSIPITAGAGVFKGKKPIAVVINEKRFSVKTWKTVVKTIMDDCLVQDMFKDRLKECVGNISGKKRVILSNEKEDMVSPLSITSNIFLETNYDTETLLNIMITRILLPIGYDLDDVSIVIRND